MTSPAHVEKVFAYSDNPLNAPEYWPSLIEVSDVEQLGELLLVNLKDRVEALEPVT